ncbi:MAG: D-aminoacyl-tRNA deacylase [Bryobacteraceae bacterium]|nr:D-aminoacyl-tRNA deacylase [Bryobacteraceae bacterium]
MRAVVQRVSRASVTVDGRISGEIGRGLLVLLGVRKGDTANDAQYLVDKIAGLRIFTDSNGKMNLSAADVGGALLVVSQFTLYGSTARGRRPSFDDAAPQDEARTLYEYFLREMERHQLPVRAGVFQAHMEVSLVNDGPVTLVIDSP